VKSREILDLLSSKRVAHYYREYNETQWFSKSDMECYRLRKLQALLKHCYEHVPYYTRIMKSVDITPSDIKTTQDIMNFPILTKELINRHYSDLIPKNLSKLKGVKTSQTGGTTGKPLVKRNDARTRSSVWGAFSRFHDWMDIKEDEWGILVTGGHINTPSLFDQVKEAAANYLQKKHFVDAYKSPDFNIKRISELLKRGNVTYIKGYCQALYELSQISELLGYDLTVKAVSSTAETLIPQYRESIEKAFKTKVFDQYGCGEIGSVAFECNHHEGLHVTEERVLMETIEDNQLLLTDLDNFAMPLVRYKNGDGVECAENVCSCGRQSTIISRVLGRTADNLTTMDGENIHWGFIFHILWESNIAVNRRFVKFQLVQDRRNSLLFRHVSDELSLSDKQIIMDGIKHFLGDVIVAFANESDIECSSSGKYRPVLNLCK